MANRVPNPSNAPHLNVAVAMMLNHLDAMAKMGLLDLESGQSLAHACMFDMQLSPLIRSQAAALFRDLRAMREKQEPPKKRKPSKDPEGEPKG